MPNREPIDTEDELTPHDRAERDAFVRKREEAERWLRELEGDGWEWSEGRARVLVHPTDPDANVAYDPYTAEVLLSPKLVEMFGGQKRPPSD